MKQTNKYIYFLIGLVCVIIIIIFGFKIVKMMSNYALSIHFTQSSDTSQIDGSTPESPSQKTTNPENKTSLHTLTFVSKDGKVVHEEMFRVGDKVHLYFEDSLAIQNLKFDWIDIEAYKGYYLSNNKSFTENDLKPYYEGMTLPDRDVKLYPLYYVYSKKKDADHFFKYEIYEDGNGKAAARVLDINNTLLKEYDSKSTYAHDSIEFNTFCLPKEITFSYDGSLSKTFYGESVYCKVKLEAEKGKAITVPVHSTNEFWYGDDLPIAVMYLPDTIKEIYRNKDKRQDSTTQVINIPCASVYEKDTIPTLQNYKNLKDLYIPCYTEIDNIPEDFLSGSKIKDLFGSPELASKELPDAAIQNYKTEFDTYTSKYLEDYFKNKGSFPSQDSDVPAMQLNYSNIPSQKYIFLNSRFLGSCPNPLCTNGFRGVQNGKVSFISPQKGVFI